VRAVVLADVGRVEVADVPEPSIEEPDDAILRVSTSAICGSDLHFLHGKAPLDVGRTIGHEAVGIVEAVGPGVARISPAQRVVVSFVIACGACWFCRGGQTQLCESSRNLGAGAFGGDLQGAQAELVRVPHADFNLLVVPDELDDELAVFLGDVGTTAYYGAAIAGIEQGDTVAVVGVGPVGFVAIHAARLLGAGSLLALDQEPGRLGLAEAAGAEPVNVTERNPRTAVDEATGGRGADVVIEAVGHPEAFETAVDVARRGGTVAVVGMYAGETIPMQLGVYWARALDIRFAGICPVHAWWERTLAEMAAGRLDPRPVISHRLPLEKAPLGYELFDAKEASKVLLLP